MVNYTYSVLFHSIHTHSLPCRACRLYSSMNSWGINLTLILMYLYLPIGVARYALLVSTNTCLTFLVPMTLFHAILAVLRPAVLVANSPRQCIKLPLQWLWPCFCLFLLSVVYYYLCVDDNPVSWDIFNSLQIQKTHCVSSLYILIPLI